MFTENIQIPIDENNVNYQKFVCNGFSYIEMVVLQFEHQESLQVFRYNFKNGMIKTLD